MDWEALSAVGTALAVVVALVLARDAERQRKKAESSRADLVAARLLETVRLLTDKSHHSMSLFGFYDGKSNEMARHFFSTAVELRGLVQAIDLGALQALDPLPRKTANRLAMALGVVDSLARELDAAEPIWAPLPYEVRSHYAARWLSLSSRATDYLRVVQRELEAAAGISAPRPSAEEIHGPWSDDD